MNRRGMLRLSAAALGGAGLTAVGLTATSGPARAQASIDLDFAGDRARLDPDGAVEAVELSLDVEWACAIPEGLDPTVAIVTVAAGAAEAEPEAIDSEETDVLFAEGDGSESFDVDLLEAEVLEADALTPEDGTRETDVTVETRLRVESDGGEALATAEDAATATVEIEREAVDAEEHGSVGGSGSLSIVVE